MGENNVNEGYYFQFTALVKIHGSYEMTRAIIWARKTTGNLDYSLIVIMTFNSIACFVIKSSCIFES